MVAILRARARHIATPQTVPASDISATLGSWQAAGDQRLFKLIISPEFGDRLDLSSFSHGIMRQVEEDLGTRLQWVATIHRNTEYPHVHVALRGITDDGEPLRIPRAYVQSGVRSRAEALATDQLGYRTSLDAEEAQRREIDQKRYTSLDRIINRRNAERTAFERPESFGFDLSNRRSRPEKDHLKGRLLFLESVGLAEPSSAQHWKVRSDFECILRELQRASDRQRALIAHGAVASDPRLPTCVTDLRKVDLLAGRVLGHREDEATGRVYMILEGTDQMVHFIYHTREVETARQRGKMKPNAFVQFIRRSIGGNTDLRVDDLGDSERLLSDQRHMRKAVQEIQRRRMIIGDNGWGGWLGKYERTLVETAHQIETERSNDKSGGQTKQNRLR